VRTRPLGRTGLAVSELTLGTWGLSGDGYGPVDEAEAARTVARAVDVGITLFETADSYGGGRMEAILGKSLPKEAMVATRIGIDLRTEPPKKCFDGAFLRERVTASLKRLRRETIDVCMLHHPSFVGLVETDAIETLLALKAEGKIRAWGVAAAHSSIAREALEKKVEVLELPYNMGHPRDLESLAGDLIIARAGVLARSVLGYGVLSGVFSPERVFPDGDHRRDRFTRMELEARLAIVDELRFLVRGDIRTLRAAAIRFVLANTVVTSAVLGPRNEQQLIELVREAGAGPRYLSDDDVREVFRVLEQAGVHV
jgi:aryl-alcohol dehydrogenase-like predicted oxidoreductase